MHDFTRRHFIKSTAVAGAAVTLGKFPMFGAAEGGAPAIAGGNGAIAPTPSWVGKPMRWAQLTLVEDDPGTFDL